MSPDSEKGLAWLITGCSTGFGREIAMAALAKGHRVAVTARQPAAVEDIVAQNPDRAIALPLDVTDREQIASAVAATEKNFGGIDVLVNNIQLPRTDVAQQSTERALEGLKNVLHGKPQIEEIAGRVQYVSEQYKGHGQGQQQQLFEQLKDQFTAQLQQAT